MRIFRTFLACLALAVPLAFAALPASAAITSQQDRGAFTLNQLRFFGQNVSLSGDGLTLAGTNPRVTVAASSSSSMAIDSHGASLAKGVANMATGSGPSRQRASPAVYA